MINLEKHYQETNEKIIFHQQKSRILSIVRLAIFLAVCIVMFLYFSQQKYKIIFGILLLLLIGAFIFFVIKYHHNQKLYQYYQIKNKVLDEYKMRIDGTWRNKLKEQGIFGTSSKQHFLKDLNIIGEKSLYSFLCVARTSHGKKLLASMLSNQNIEIDSHQQAVKELNENIEFCLDFQTKLKKIENGTELYYNFEENGRKFWPFFLIGTIASLAFLSIAILSIIGIISSLFISIPIIVSLGTYFIFNLLYGKEFRDLSSIFNTCTNIISSFSILKDKSFSSQILQEKQQKIIMALEGMKKIKKWADYDTFRMNFLTLVLFNAIFPLSLLVFNRYQNVASIYEKEVQEAIKAFSELEAYVSLAILPQVRKNVCLPKKNDKKMIEATNITHPLLDEDKAIGNDFTTNTTINIVTGSNMSGKTSFMRTLGINLVLFNAGGYVCGSSFCSDYFQIFTSIDVSDSLHNGISTFYAEVLRIKEAVEYKETGANIITLIDEIFKGTNNADRLLGAKALLKNLSGDNSVVLLTTHDFEISEAKDVDIVNYHFGEYYQDGQMLFSYKLQPGKCQTTNALFLLRKAGIKGV